MAAEGEGGVVPVTGTVRWGRRAALLDLGDGGVSLPKPAGGTRVWYVNGAPTLVAQKVYHMLLRHAYGEWSGSPGKAYTLTLSEIAAFLHRDGGARHTHAKIRTILQEIQETMVGYSFYAMENGARTHWTGQTFLMSFAASEDADRVVFFLPTDIERFMMDPEYYCYVEEGVVRKASSKYTMPTYETFAALVVSRDTAEASYDPTDLAISIGYPVPASGKVEAHKLHRSVVVPVAEDVNRHSQTITVETSKPDRVIRVKVTRRAKASAEELGLARPEAALVGRPSPRPCIPSKPTKEAIRLWKENYPDEGIDPWWDDFRVKCGHDPSYKRSMAFKFVERVRTLKAEYMHALQTVAMPADWRTVPDPVVELAVSRYGKRLPLWRGKGRFQGSRAERMLLMWHAYLRWLEAELKVGQPWAKTMLDEAIADSGAAFMKMLAQDGVSKWPFLLAWEAGQVGGYENVVE